MSAPSLSRTSSGGADHVAWTPTPAGIRPGSGARALSLSVPRSRLLLSLTVPVHGWNGDEWRRGDTRI
jgi:hypothetical protein